MRHTEANCDINSNNKGHRQRMDTEGCEKGKAGFSYYRAEPAFFYSSEKIQFQSPQVSLIL